jgi:tRNAThr (cytosine32-N3)-methyltransferase
VEIGAGAGNTAFPIMKRNRNPLLTLHACDFSKAAIKVMKESDLYNSPEQIGTLKASVWDAAAAKTESNPDNSIQDSQEEASSLPQGITPGTVDVVLLIFIFSALAPTQWQNCIRNIHHMLKPGGIVLFRDYGRGDLAQLRFKSGRYLEENFYVRGDGTRVYFFAEEELKSLWSRSEAGDDEEEGEGKSDDGVLKEYESGAARSGHQLKPQADGSDMKDDEAPATLPSFPKFDILDFGIDRRMLVNRQRRLKMYRCWMQARFRKPTTALQTTSTISTMADLP